MALLAVEHLNVALLSGPRVLSDVSLTMAPGEALGVVGESGSGKSVTMLALMGLVPYPGRVRAKRLAFAGRDLLKKRGLRAPGSAWGAADSVSHPDLERAKRLF